MAGSARDSRSLSGRAAGWAGGLTLALMVLACLFTVPWTMGRVATVPGADAAGPRRYEVAELEQGLLPPFWAAHAPDERQRLEDAARRAGRAPRHLLGTDRLGRDLLVRCLAGGSISLGVGIVAAALAVIIGTLWGTAAGYRGGRLDAAMMRTVDVLYGLPNILLVVLLSVAADGLIERAEAAAAAGSHAGWSGLVIRHKGLVNVTTLFVAIGAVSWLTMARVIRGQVLSLRAMPFMEAARAVGVPWPRLVRRHLLPSLAGPIVVYATLTVPSAILAESFLSFLGIGVREPLPSWGNLAADGLSELNTVRVRWWLLVWPCLLIGLTLLSLNFLGEALREGLDPRRTRGR